MAPKSKKKRHSDTAFESSKTPRQLHFPSRRREVLGRRTDTATPKTKQQTLTQIDFVSRIPDSEDDLDLEYEEEEPTPRPTKKRRVEEQPSVLPNIQKPTPKLRTYIRTADVRRATRRLEAQRMNEDALLSSDKAAPPETPSIRNTRSSRSNIVKNEQAQDLETAGLAALKPKRARKYVANVGLQTPQAEEPRTASPKRRSNAKRGRPSTAIDIDDEHEVARELLKTRKAVTTRRRTSKQVTADVGIAPGALSVGVDGSSRMPLPTVDAQLSSVQPDLPPLTPKWNETRVVPSSQSPTHSQVSTQSPAKSQTSRSPLKHLSTNMTPFKNRTGPKKPPRFEVRDTFNESVSSQVSTQPSKPREGSSSDKQSESSSNSSSIPQDLPVSALSSTTLTPTPKAAATVKTEILDTDDERSELGENEADEFAPGDETQGAFNILSSSSVLSSCDMEELPDGMEDPTADDCADADPLPLISQTNSTKDTQIKTEARSQALPRTNRVQRPSSQIDLPTESQEVAAQLNADLGRASQRFIRRRIPSSQTGEEAPHSSSEPTEDSYTLPASPSARRSTAPQHPRRPPVPPSQATTVDFSSQILPGATTGSARTPSTTIPTSTNTRSYGPRRTAALPNIHFSSSPLESTKVIWDGKPMTESQMLPDSLMNFELPRILGGGNFTQDGLVEDTDEE